MARDNSRTVTELVFRIDTVTNPLSLVIRLLFWLHIINATLHYGYTVTRLHIDGTLYFGYSSALM